MDWKKCWLCQKVNGNEKLQSSADISATVALIGRLKTLEMLKELPRDFTKPLNDLKKLGSTDEALAPEIIERKGKVHKSCKNLANSRQISRAEERAKKRAPPPADNNKTSPKKLRSDIGVVTSPGPSTGCGLYRQYKCLICQLPPDAVDGQWSLAETMVTKENSLVATAVANIREWATITQNKGVLVRLPINDDLVAHDIGWHKTCYTQLHNDARPAIKEKKPEFEPEFMNLIIQKVLNNTNEPPYTVASLVHDYVQFMHESNVDSTFGYSDVHSGRFREYLLRELGSEWKHVKTGRHVTILKNVELSKFVADHAEQKQNVLRAAAEHLREDILAADVPPFDGHFGENVLTHCVPEPLLQFISTVLEGHWGDLPPVDQGDRNLPARVKVAAVISQLLMFNTKLAKSKPYRRNKASLRRSKRLEMPIPLWIGFLIHGTLRGKSHLKKLCQLGLTVPYLRILSLSFLHQPSQGSHQ